MGVGARTVEAGLLISPASTPFIKSVLGDREIMGAL
jgi:hypothetical protein